MTSNAAWGFGSPDMAAIMNFAIEAGVAFDPLLVPVVPEKSSSPAIARNFAWANATSCDMPNRSQVLRRRRRLSKLGKRGAAKLDFHSAAELGSPPVADRRCYERYRAAWRSL